jgi:hypothetical protein
VNGGGEFGKFRFHMFNGRIGKGTSCIWLILKECMSNSLFKLSFKYIILVIG